jgi:hypothetical protein
LLVVAASTYNTHSIISGSANNYYVTLSYSKDLNNKQLEVGKTKIIKNNKKPVFYEGFFFFNTFTFYLRNFFSNLLVI